MNDEFASAPCKKSYFGKPVEPETTRKARVIEVIETVSIRGNGVDTTVREVIQYWSKDGVLLAEKDPVKA